MSRRGAARHGRGRGKSNRQAELQFESNEDCVVVENLRRFYVNKYEHSGYGRKLNQLKLQDYVRLGRSTKTGIQPEAFEFWKKLRQQAEEISEGSDFSRLTNGLLTLEAAKYLLREDNEEIAEKLHLHELAQKVVQAHERQSEHLQRVAAEMVSLSADEDYDMEDVLGLQQATTPSHLASCLVNPEIRQEYETGMLEALQNEILPAEIGLIDLSEEQMAILARAEAAEPTLTFERFFAHFLVWKLTPLQHGTHFLQMVRKYKVNMNYEELPITCATILKVTKEERKKAAKMRFIKGPIVPGRPQMMTAEYLNLGGIERVLLGTSCGLVAKWEYFATMRIVYTLFPEMVPPEIYEAISPKSSEVYDVGLLKHWNSLKKPEYYASAADTQRCLVLLIHGHIDGVQWYINSSKSQGVPILGRLVGIKEEVSGDMVKIPTLDPFVVGVMQTISGREVDTKEFVKDFVYELKKLSNPEVSGLSFKVNIFKSNYTKYERFLENSYTCIHL